MDINQSLQPVIQSLLNDLKSNIESEFRATLSEQVSNQIANQEIEKIIKQSVEQVVNQKVNDFNFVNLSQEQLTIVLHKIKDQINTDLTETARVQIQNHIGQLISSLDFTKFVSLYLDQKLSLLIDSKNFPAESIPHSAINFSGMILNGDQVKGGIIEQFGSVGIEDRATHVQMTLMDHATVFEGSVWAPELKIQGDVVINGKISVLGEFDSQSTAIEKLIVVTSEATKQLLDAELFTRFSDIIFEKIQSAGLDLDIFKQGGRDVIKGNQLGYHITDTNIQRLGLVRDFQTQGENLLSETLYVTKGRVGVNTMEPSSALSIWDEEVEVNVTKRGIDTAYVGTTRHQKVILGSNNKENLILNQDGSIKVNSLQLSNVKMTSGSEIPNYEGIKGQIVWNDNPSVGSVIGWVCLGKHLWAKFGKIE